ncbi:hypothetical protein D3C72_1724570 [compost metagenome]
MVVFGFGHIRRKHVALDRQQTPILAPGAQRFVFFQRHDQLVRPLAPHARTAHPGHRFEHAAHAFQVGREKIALDAAQSAAAQGQVIHVAQALVVRAFHLDRAQVEHGTLRHPPDAGGHAHDQNRGQQAVGGRVQAFSVMPHISAVPCAFSGARRRRFPGTGLHS